MDIFEIWCKIFGNIYFWKDALKIRMVNKNSNSAFYEFLDKCKLMSFPRRTFIEMDTCMCCGKIRKEIREIVYTHDSYPARRLYYCDSFICFVASLKKYLKDIQLENVYPFINVRKKNVWVPRSAGGYSIGNVISNFIINHKDNWCIHVSFENHVFESKSIIIPQTERKFQDLIKLLNVSQLPDDTVRIDGLFLSSFKDMSIPYSKT